MSYLATALRKALWATCACVLLLAPAAAAAEHSLTADFDGDGLRDRVTLNFDEPSLLHVWLSSTDTTTTIRTSDPVIHIVATDLDGDQRAELIARGSNTSLQIWTKKRKGFHAYHPKRATTAAFDRPTHHRFDDGPSEPPSAVPWAGPSALALSLSGQPRAPALLQLRSLASVADVRPSRLPFPPLAPRPPPSTL